MWIEPMNKVIELNTEAYFVADYPLELGGYPAIWTADLPPDGLYKGRYTSYEMLETGECVSGVWVDEGGPNIEDVKQIAGIAESQWRAKEMDFIANNLLYIEDENDLAAPPLVSKSWRNYRKQVMAWDQENPDFPDSSKRPVAPS